MSLRKAINGKCRDCIWDPLAKGTWLAQVERCELTECSLHQVRPKSRHRVKRDTRMVVGSGIEV